MSLRSDCWTLNQLPSYKCKFIQDVQEKKNCSTVCKPSYLMVPVRTWANINRGPKKARLSFSVPVIASAFWEIVFLPNGQHAGSKIKPPVLQASLGGLCEKSTLFHIKSFFLDCRGNFGLTSSSGPRVVLETRAVGLWDVESRSE